MSTTTKTPESLPGVQAPGKHEPTPPRSGKPKKRGLIWVVFLLLIAGVAGYAVWHAGDANFVPTKGQGGGGGGFGGGGGRGAGLGPVPVVVTTVGRSSIPVYINGLGSVSPFYTVALKSRVDGQLMEVRYKEGDLVQKDAPLVEVDPRPYQVQLEQAEG